MKKVIFVINSISDKRNSAAYQRSKMLSENFDCILLTKSPPPEELKEKFTKVFLLNFSFFTYFIFIYKIFLLKKKSNYHLIYTQHNIYTLSVGYFSKVFLNCTWIYDLWDHPSLGFQVSKKISRKIKSAYWKAFGFNMLKRADLWIVAMSPSIYKYLPKFNGKTLEISRGYNIQENTLNRNKSILFNAPLILVSIGWLSETRGTKTLISILKNLEERNINAVIRAAGPIDLFSKKTVDYHNKTSLNKLEYMGYLSRKEILKVYEDAHIGFCFLDKTIINYNYAYPIKVVEYMLNKTLVIGTDTHGIKSIINNGKNGFIVSNEEIDTVTIIEKLISNPKLYQAIVSTAYEQAILNYDIKAVESEIINEINTLYS